MTSVSGGVSGPGVDDEDAVSSASDSRESRPPRTPSRLDNSSLKLSSDEDVDKDTDVGSDHGQPIAVNLPVSPPELPKIEAEDEPFAEAATPPPLTTLEVPTSPVSSYSGPDDTASKQASLHSSPSSSFPGTRPSSRFSPSPSAQPFERRFQARLSSSGSIHRISSPAFLSAHSRQSSISSQLTYQSQDEESNQPEESTQRPWDVIRWTRLKKITSQAFSEAGKRAFGRPTYLTVAAFIVVGTSKGLILLFDYQQTLKNIIGQGTQAPECGPVTSLAISADHSTLAAGHANGSIFTWEISSSTRPFLHIPPIKSSQIGDGRFHGHVLGASVLHVGFLGQRHTALVSADDSGMAFSHLATRGLGPVARSVKTTRILGRYPDLIKEPMSLRKPSSVLAFAPLPLGNIEQTTDDMSLTALLTPYLLVIVSTTPLAQTQFKKPRDKEVAKHGALTGCLAWFPSVRLKYTEVPASPSFSKTKLVYCWSNVLSVLEVEESAPSPGAEPVTPTLNFIARSRWICDEAILTVQWISRSVLALLTLTQRLIILEDVSMRVADFSDVSPKHIFHQDLFSEQLQLLVDQVDQGDISMHGVIPDAFHMSFKAYKGRLFLLGVNDLWMGTLSNWADRLFALMGVEKHITAMELATAYYNGETEKSTIGLPEQDEKRHEMVREKLLQMIPASLSYSFGEERDRDSAEEWRRGLQQLATACFTACLSMNELNLLYDEVYPWYRNVSMFDIFFGTLETYIKNGKIITLDPEVFKDLVEWYSASGYGERLQELICALETSTMDIDQVTGVCLQLHLYDALAYVWNDALNDFITPLIHFLSLLTTAKSDDSLENYESASKMFPYMAYTLTGRLYPSGNDISDDDAAFNAKASVYQFLFSLRPMSWPTEQSPVVRTQPGEKSEPTYPYLRAILKFDSSNFLSMLNEVFEDSFLNRENPEQHTNGLSSQSHKSHSTKISRSTIVLKFMTILDEPGLDEEVRMFLNIFIARTYAKFHEGQERILLKESVLQNIVRSLCSYPHIELADERQLSVEYLLSVYYPTDIDSLIPLFTKAKFYRVLKAVYRRNKQYSKWLTLFFEDPEDRQSIFNCVKDLLGQASVLANRQKEQVKAVIRDRAKDLGAIDAASTARVLQDVAPELLDDVLAELDDLSSSQYLFLQQLLEPSRQTQRATMVGNVSQEYRERYVKLMCIHERPHVAEYIGKLDTGDLRLSEILPAMEESGVIDAEVTLMARDGLVREAMDRLIRHLHILENVILGLMDVAAEDHPDLATAFEATQDQLESLQKYVRIGIWLCQGQLGKISSRPSKRRDLQQLSSLKEEDLTPSELLWLDLLDTTVQIARRLTSADSDQKVSELVRAMVQDGFSSLLVLTTTASSSTSRDVARKPADSRNSLPASSPSLPAKKLRDESMSAQVDFLTVLSAFLQRIAHRSPTLADLRKVLSDIFAAHAFEESILQLAQAFLNKDAFAGVEDAERRRKAGWMPLGRSCGVCSRVIWGRGAGLGAWQAWAERQDEKQTKRRIAPTSQRKEGAQHDERTDNGKGKARAPTPAPAPAPEENSHGTPAPPTATQMGEAFVVFSCQHLYHQKCFDRVLAERQKGGKSGSERQLDYKCLICESVPVSN